jgi:hypothetical protein
VAIRINPVEQWIKMEDSQAENAPLGQIDDEETISSSDDEEVDGAAAAVAAAAVSVDSLTPLQELQKIASTRNLRPTGVVVAVLEAKHPTQYVGWLKGTNDDEPLTRESKFAFFFPFNKKMHRILVPC